MNMAPPETNDPAGLATAQVILKPRKARPFCGRHPWVLDTAIDRIEGPAEAGAVVDLIAHNGKFVARGLYNPTQPHSSPAVHLGGRRVPG